MVRKNRTRVRDRKRSSIPPVWRHVFIGVGVCTVVVLLTAGVWYVTRIPSVTIAAIDVTGGETIAHDVVREAIDNVLRGGYLSLIPHRFMLLYPHDALVASVASIPRVKDVTIERSPDRTLSVSFTEYVPYALWCKGGEDTNECYFLDENGYAFAAGPRLEGGTLVRHIMESEQELEQKQVFEVGAFHRVHALLDRLRNELRLRVTDVLYTADGDLKLRVNGGGEIIIRNDGVFDGAFENLVSVLSSDAFRHIEPGNFKYIDLRFGNKVFVNEHLESEVTESATGTSATNTVAE